MIVRQARALSHILERMPIRILPRELLVGAAADSVPAAALYPEAHGTRVIPELDGLRTRQLRPFSIEDDAIRALTGPVASYWSDKSMLYHIEKDTPSNIMDTLYSGGIFVLSEMAGYGHVSINYPMLLSVGFRKLETIAKRKAREVQKKRLHDTEKADFYSAAAIVAAAAIGFAERYADLASRQAATETDTVRAHELRDIAEVCRRVPAEPPRTFREALQFIRFTHLILSLETYDGQAISMGRMDQYLFPLYQQDTRLGRMNREKAIELIENLWLKVNELVPLFDSLVGMYFEGLLTTQAVTLGGLDSSGRDATNELTYVILEATKQAALPLPNAHVRLNKDSPPSLFREVSGTIASGVNNIALFNDGAIVRSLVRKDIPEREARDYSTVGCVELAPFGTSFTSSDAALFNVAACLELALNNGVSVQLGPKLGCETGDAEKFASMEDVIDAFRKQVSYLVGLMAEGSNCFEKVNLELKPTPFLSLCVKDCFEQGRDITAGSARYNFTGVQGVGIADVADSLTAIDRLVFQEKRITMAELLGGLRSGLATNDALCRLLQNRAPKYGNDDDTADRYAALVARIYSEEVEKHKNIRGGYFIPGMYSVSTHVPFGYMTGALPSGRIEGTALSNGASPCTSSMRQGPTAAIRSACKIDYSRYANGVAFTVGLDRSTVSGAEGVELLTSLIKSHLELGGMQIQFNFTDPQELREAQLNPEAHRNLLVRVAGYSAYFVDLAKDVQEDVIARFHRS